MDLRHSPKNNGKALFILPRQIIKSFNAEDLQILAVTACLIRPIKKQPHNSF